MKLTIRPIPGRSERRKAKIDALAYTTAGIPDRFLEDVVWWVDEGPLPAKTRRRKFPKRDDGVPGCASA